MLRLVLFDRVLCGVDGSAESLVAARQISELAPSGATLLLVAVTQPTAVAPGWPAVAAPLLAGKRAAEDALERARAAVSERIAATATLLEGAPIPTLLAAADSERATLLAVGIHRSSRVAGIALGSVATAMLHDAPCSVYLARAPAPPAVGEIVVGVDAFADSIEAVRAARELADRLGARLRALVGCGDQRVDLDLVRHRVGDLPLEVDERPPVDALAAARADLLVVGSRGLHGITALGSVSERIAHAARCSVLVVREHQG